MCPVHTPDGAPCGLLNHLACACEILTHPCDIPRPLVVKTLVSLGLLPLQSGALLPTEYLTCVLDGVVVGKLPPALLSSYVFRSREVHFEFCRVCPMRKSSGLLVPMRISILALFDYVRSWSLSGRVVRSNLHGLC